MGRMTSKSTIFLTAWLLLTILAMPAIAWWQPYCSGCCYWDGEHCRGWCGKCRICMFCMYCVNTGNCTSDADCPGGPCKGCVNCNCQDDDSKCNSANCESCVDGQCVVCGGDPNQRCCMGECCGADQCCDSILGCVSECPSCRFCNNGYCDDLCLECSDCVGGICMSCGEQGKVCCDGWCEPPCEQYVQNDCNPSNNTDCLKCGGADGCATTKKVYTGNNTTTCSGGCFGDCQTQNDEVCYTEYSCEVVSIEDDATCWDTGDGCKPFPGMSCAVCGQKPQGIPYPSTQAACQ